MQIKANADATALQAERELHLRNADAAQSSMKSDFECANNTNTTWSIAFDFQQTLPTPHINTSVTDSFMNMWSEDTTGRGSYEVVSYKIRTLTPKIFLLTISLHGQTLGVGKNKNKNVVSFWYYIVHMKQLFMTVEHTFPLLGHTFLPCDREFGVIFF